MTRISPAWRVSSSRLASSAMPGPAIMPDRMSVGDLIAAINGWATDVAAAGFMVWLLRSHPQQTLFCFALSLVLGGAVGNVVDRMLWGHVIDFLDFHWPWLSPIFYQGHFPAFNMADSAISVGAVCLIADELIRVRRSRT